MKKILKRLGLTLLTLIIFSGLFLFFYLKSTAPQYSGTVKIGRLLEEVEVFYDTYGIPHIYAQNAEDAYFALGYVHAQDRLFQMELIRRAGSGRLSEIFGAKTIETDKFFRTIGIRKAAEKSAKIYLNKKEQPYQKAAFAYLDGVNSFLYSANLPVEYKMLGIEIEEFTPTDIYTVLGYTAFGFSNSTVQESIVDRISSKYGMNYLSDLDLDISDSQASAKNDTVLVTQLNIQKLFAAAKATAPFPMKFGSNSWVLAPSKSKSGKVIFANDTHIFFSQPSVWYEAHIEYPGYSFYGNHLALSPFGMVGHTRDLAWGLTIFPHDNVDLYKEKSNPKKPNQVWENDRWVDLEISKQIIKVKDAESVNFTIKTSRHGPLLTGLEFNKVSYWHDPIAMRWVLHEMPTKILESTYNLNHSKNIDDTREAVKLIDILGLNVLYGDNKGNIAQWSTGKISKRPAHVNSKVILDGASGKDELLGYYDFSENPQYENPASGFLSSANEKPKPVNGITYPGYYTPDFRAKRIENILKTKEKWSLEDMKPIHKDVVSNEDPVFTKIILGKVSTNKSTLHKEAFDLLINWDGDYKIDDLAPTIFNKMQYYVLEYSLKDELGLDDFEGLVSSYLLKRSFKKFYNNDESVWWDNILTEDTKETREIIFQKAFDKTIEDLTLQLGENIQEWQWGKVHTLTHKHPLGSVKQLSKYFNVGPFPIQGSNCVINKMAFPLNANGEYKAAWGPALRILIDFNDIENSESINPTGQSGNVMSKHYKDQAEMFNDVVYRKQMMNEKEIKSTFENKLVLTPNK